MSHTEVVALVGKLKAVTVERGATPAEAAAAASHVRRLIAQIAHRNGSETAARAPRHAALSPGVHVRISRRVAPAGVLVVRPAQR
jgi:hypothetical protein